MSVKEVNGNIWNTECKTIVIPVNTVGVMGAGLALQLKERHYDVYERYRDNCKEGGLIIGDVIYDDRFLLFPTKSDWRNPSKMEYIREGLDFMENIPDMFYKYEVESLAVPALGCGYGGLRWKDVKPLILATLEKLPIPCELYLYGGVK